MPSARLLPRTMTTPSSSAAQPFARHALGEWAVDAQELARAWRILHDPQAPALPWGQRLLALSSLYPSRPSAWLLALEARLSALEAHIRQFGLVPDDKVFAMAAQAPLQAHEDAYLFPRDTRW